MPVASALFRKNYTMLGLVFAGAFAFEMCVAAGDLGIGVGLSC